MSKDLSVQDTNKRISLFSAENFEHYCNVANSIASSQLVPKNLQGKPMDVLIAMEYGNQLGIPTMQAVQDIAVVNGKPTLYGDGLLAACQAHPHYEYIKETPIVEKNNVIGYQCIIKRKNHDEYCVVFTIDDAKKANLWGKDGPWSQYPSRMLQMRARGFALRSIFADALRGIKCTEEVEDYQDQPEHKKSAASSTVDDLLKKKKTESQPEPEVVNLASQDQIDLILELLKQAKFSKERIEKGLNHFGVESIDMLTIDDADKFQHILEREIESKQ